MYAYSSARMGANGARAGGKRMDDKGKTRRPVWRHSSRSGRVCSKASQRRTEIYDALHNFTMGVVTGGAPRVFENGGGYC